MSNRKQFFKDPLGQHIRLYAVIYNSPAWCSLSTTAKALWCDMRCQINDYNNGTASCALGILSHKGWSSRHTVSKARNQLEALGLIQLTKAGGICYGGKTPNLYRFTDLDMCDQPKKGFTSKKADHLYREFKTKSEASQRLNELEKNKKSKVKKLDKLCIDSTLSDNNLSAVITQTENCYGQEKHLVN